MNRISSIRELTPGTRIPEFIRTVDSADLVRYSGGSDDYAPQHWNHPYMVERGFSDVIVHGWFTFAIMCQAVTNWIPLEIADITKYAVRYHKVTYPGTLSFGGEVVQTSAEHGVDRAELKLWAKDADGEVTTTASLTVAFA